MSIQKFWKFKLTQGDQNDGDVKRVTALRDLAAKEALLEQAQLNNAGYDKNLKEVDAEVLYLT